MNLCHAVLFDEIKSIIHWVGCVALIHGYSEKLKLSKIERVGTWTGDRDHDRGSSDSQTS